MPENQGNSTRPYLLRALHEWCTDNGFTPYIAVHVGADVQVPMEYVKNNEIVLNIGFEATSGLKLGNEAVEFRARFGGVSRDIMVPVGHVVAIYARENGQGMAFPMPSLADAGGAAATQAPAAPALRLATVDGAGSAPTAVKTRSRSAGPKPIGVQTSAPGAGSDASGKAGAQGPKPARSLHSARMQAAPGPNPNSSPGSPSALADASIRKSADKPNDKPNDKPPAGPRPTLKRVK